MRKLIIVLVTLNIIAGIGWTVSLLWKSYYVHEKQMKQMVSVAESQEKMGFLKKSDFLRLAPLSQSLRATGTIKDQDVEWACSIIHDSFKKDYSHGSMDRMFVVFTLAHDLKRVTPAQRDKLYNAILPMATIHDENNSSAEDKPMFCALSKALGEPKAIPVMLPFLNDSRPRVRKWAKSAINYLQKQSANSVPSG